MLVVQISMRQTYFVLKLCLFFFVSVVSFHFPSICMLMCFENYFHLSLFHWNVHRLSHASEHFNNCILLNNNIWIFLEMCCHTFLSFSLDCILLAIFGRIFVLFLYASLKIQSQCLNKWIRCIVAYFVSSLNLKLKDSLPSEYTSRYEWLQLNTRHFSFVFTLICPNIFVTFASFRFVWKTTQPTMQMIQRKYAEKSQKFATESVLIIVRLCGKFMGMGNRMRWAILAFCIVQMLPYHKSTTFNYLKNIHQHNSPRKAFSISSDTNHSESYRCRAIVTNRSIRLHPSPMWNQKYALKSSDYDTLLQLYHHFITIFYNRF